VGVSNQKQNDSGMVSPRVRLRRWFREGVWVACWLILGQGSALLSLLWISRKIPPEVFGQLSSGLAVQNYVVIVGTLGLRTLAVRDLARDPNGLGSIWGTYWLLLGPAGILVAGSGHFVSDFLFSRTDPEIWMSLWLTCGACFSVLSLVPLLDALGRQSVALGIVAVTEVAFFIALFAGRIPLDIASLGGAFAIKWISASLLQACVLYLLSRPIRLMFDAEQAKRWMRSALPLLLTGLVMNLPIMGAVIITRHFLDSEETAVMGLAAQLAAAVLLLGGIAVRYIQPIWRDQLTLREENSLKIIKSMAIVGGVCWLLGVTGVYLIVHFWLPPEFANGLSVILMMMVTAGLGVVARVLWIALLAVDQERIVLLAYSAGCGIFVAFSVGLVFFFKTEGIACSAVLGMGVTASFMWNRVRLLLPQTS